jgi:hypothetical protein
MNWKKWFQMWGGGLMLSGLLGGRQVQVWHPKIFLAGVLMFASTFITWKRSGKDDDLDKGPGA